MTDDDLSTVKNSPATNQADLERLWRALMGDLGFGGRSLWLLLLDPTGRAAPVLPQIEGLPDAPDDQAVDSLIDLLVHLNHQHGGSVALLLSRPGDDIEDHDILWARALAAGAKRAALPLWPTHLATDTRLRVIAPDDLAQVSIELMSP